ncbi:hypothetical protein [Listeria kieliensis]|nr:hypothetical protein [Listeria kieliensis]
MDKVEYLSQFRKEGELQTIKDIQFPQLLGDWYEVFLEEDRKTRVIKSI